MDEQEQQNFEKQIGIEPSPDGQTLVATEGQAPPTSTPSHKKLIIGIIAVFLLVAGSAGAYFYVNQRGDVGTTVCTADAKICPDGSAVGRVGPSCEFAECPENIAIGENIVKSESVDKYLIPDGYKMHKNDSGYWRVFIPEDQYYGYLFVTKEDGERFISQHKSEESVEKRTYVNEVYSFALDYPGEWFIYESEFFNDRKNIVVRVSNGRIEYSNGVNISNITSKILEQLSEKELTIKAIQVLIDYQNFESPYAKLYGRPDEYSSTVINLGGYEAVLAIGLEDPLAHESLLGSVTVLLNGGQIIRIPFFEDNRFGSKDVALSFRKIEKI